MKKLITVFMLLASITFSYSQDYSEVKKIDEKAVITNHKEIPKIVNNFIDACRYYGVDYQEKVRNLKAIRLVTSDRNFLAGESNGVISINSELANFPNLLKIIVNRRLGIYFGLKDSDKFPDVMSTKWNINPKSEYYAYNNLERGFMLKHFYKALAEKNPLEKQI
ncbi:MAG: hypothetical protein CMP12_21290 [Zunongwangia sp.]|uniref:Uncharacterized protein n=2 Tax=Zunongwangia profunda TaxID=398743 RepID=D5BFA5_ZUNPS|nr:hypothetical protein [Zunongwangia profunda]ADF53003.1 hypothetical protein ZPR_2681 [Zunongwangia profunda SM-A87]MAO38394.1 hypothetical protein [Zunongwangia sp.]MAS70889.1 hypothetical protein [Zunongwangia sp.]HCV79700.1 hypothetical protein [Zunongwangia profunda]|tara:strand:+ start:14324 stop:14818 length:495 start_codon:yes stop_codon:yes gene_type:complete